MSRFVEQIPEGWLSLAELAELKGVTYQTAIRWVHEGMPCSTFKLVGKKATRYVHPLVVNTWLKGEVRLWRRVDD